MKLSVALSNFLNKKRTVEIQPAPEIEASNDKYLEEFSSSIQQSLSAQKKSKSKNDSEHELTVDDESKEEVGLDVRKDSIVNFASSLTTSRSHGAETEDGEGSGVEDKGSEDGEGPSKRLKELEADPRIMCIRLFNLPWRLTGEDALIYFCDDLNITCEEAKFDYNEDGEFAGSARVWVRLHTIPKVKMGERGREMNEEEEGEEEEGEEDGEEEEEDEIGLEKRREAERSDIIKRMQGQDCGGRPVKAVRAGKDRGGETYIRYTVQEYEHSERYYDRMSCISVKCNACGEVGHMEKECDRPRRAAPCHLCSKPHDAFNCTNIVCYRCQEVGHHSKECLIPYKRLMNLCLKQPLAMPSSQATVLQSMCSHCGSRTHNFRFCPDVLLSPSPSVVDATSAIATTVTADRDPCMICMVCGKRGHAMCRKSLPSLAQPKSLDLGWAQHIDPRFPSAAKGEPKETAAVEMVESSDVKAYCPYCGSSGHHADYLAGKGGYDRGAVRKYDNKTKCQGDLARRMAAEREKLEVNQRLRAGRGSGGAGSDKKRNSRWGREVTIHGTARGSSAPPKVGRFSPRESAGGEADWVAGQKRKRDPLEDEDEDEDEDGDESDDSVSGSGNSSGGDDDDEDYMSAKFLDDRAHSQEEGGDSSAKKKKKKKSVKAKRKERHQRKRERKEKKKGEKTKKDKDRKKDKKQKKSRRN